MGIGQQQQLTGTVPKDIELSECHISRVGSRTAEMFYREWHYSKGVGNAAMSWGMYYNGHLLGVISFHTPISEQVRASIFGEDHVDNVTELHRLALHENAPHNSASWFISRGLDALKDYKPKYWAVVSFADETEGHQGTIYQAANADYYGRSGQATYFKDESGRLRAPRQCGENICLSDAESRGWEKVKRQPKHRYVFWLPDEYQSKEDLREKAEIDMQPYPDNDN